MRANCVSKRSGAAIRSASVTPRSRRTFSALRRSAMSMGRENGAGCRVMKGEGMVCYREGLVWRPAVNQGAGCFAFAWHPLTYN